MNKPLNFLLIVTLCSSILYGCGYQLGLVGTDKNVKKIYCYTVRNHTRRPGLEMPATNSIIRELQKRGEFLTVVSNPEDADTYLYVALIAITRTAARLSDADFLEESSVALTAEIRLYHSQISYDEETFTVIESEPPFYTQAVVVDTSFFIEPNQPEGEYAIIPQLMEKLGRDVVYKILDRWNVPES
ncbi:hypothetical protein KDK77_07090 [bacterium]|nr:hypothetical protein [bacterium]MCP5462531.1 hypothetical protein [bacterium]